MFGYYCLNETNVQSPSVKSSAIFHVNCVFNEWIQSSTHVCLSFCYFHGQIYHTVTLLMNIYNVKHHYISGCEKCIFELPPPFPVTELKNRMF